MRILVTGGCGFIGSNFIHHLLRTYSDVSIINVDKLTYAGNLENLSDLSHSPRYRFMRGDIAEASLVEELIKKGVDAIVNFAAESHVDRSIEDPKYLYEDQYLWNLCSLGSNEEGFPRAEGPFHSYLDR